jgi:hypothetical protein
MKFNPIFVVAGAATIAATAGITYAVVQSSRQPEAVVPTPSTIVQSPASPTEPQAQPLPTASSPTASNPTASNPTSVTPASPPVAPEQPIEKPTVAKSAPIANAKPTRTIESCKITMAQVNDSDPPLNVRAAPTTAEKVVGKLDNKAWVTVAESKEGWLRITAPVAGWIAQTRTESNCNQKVERVNFAPGGSSATIADRFIGTGVHKYLFNLRQGQQFTITHTNDAAPIVYTPNGTVLLAETGSEGQKTRSARLAQSGDYVVEQSSNFRGYPYEFFVEVK